MKTYFAYSSKEQYHFKAKNISDAKTWIQNHLDCSQEWTLGEVINPTIKPTQ